MATQKEKEEEEEDYMDMSGLAFIDYVKEFLLILKYSVKTV